MRAGCLLISVLQKPPKNSVLHIKSIQSSGLSVLQNSTPHSARMKVLTPLNILDKACFQEDRGINMGT